jgi:hypothetical protein
MKATQAAFQDVDQRLERLQKAMFSFSTADIVCLVVIINELRKVHDHVALI